MMRSAKIFLALAAVLCSCNRGAVPPINPEKVFSDTEKAISVHYFSGSENETADFPRLYAAAIAALEPSENAKADLNTLVKIIQAGGADKVRERTYRALNAFLSALPGANSFARPEGLILSGDKDRQAGIGILLTQQGPGRFLVLDTLEGSPATIAGIRPGSVLKTIDGLEVKDMDIEEVAGRIRGKEGIPVKLGLYGNDFELKRARIGLVKFSNNTWTTNTGGQVEIIAIRMTLPGTAEELKNFLLQMGTRSAVILDLRKLQQGDYEECFKVADLFVGKRKLGSMIAKEEGRPPAKTEINGNPDTLFTGPVYVIIGKNSSPAADVVASAIRSSLEVNLIGTDRPGLAYLTAPVPIDSGITLQITRGVVTDPQDIPLPRTGVKMDVAVDDYLPIGPPGSKPSQDDPAHKQLSTILQLK